jgi:hypothetical protein
MNGWQRFKLTAPNRDPGGERNNIVPKSVSRAHFALGVAFGETKYDREKKTCVIRFATK